MAYNRHLGTTESSGEQEWLPAVPLGQHSSAQSEGTQLGAPTEGKEEQKVGLTFQLFRTLAEILVSVSPDLVLMGRHRILDASP